MSSSDDELTAADLALLAADEASRLLAELPMPSGTQEFAAAGGELDLAACEAEDEEVRRRTAQALARLQTDRDDFKSLLSETQRNEDELDDWRGRRHALLHDGLREALAAVAELSADSDDEQLAHLRAGAEELVTGFAAEQLREVYRRANAGDADRSPAPALATRSSARGSYGTAVGSSLHEGDALADVSLYDLLAGGDARLEAHHHNATAAAPAAAITSCSRPGSSNTGCSNSGSSDPWSHSQAGSSSPPGVNTLGSNQPGSRPGSRMGIQPGTQAETPGSRLGSQAESQVGSQAGSRVGSQAGSQAGSRAGSRPVSAARGSRPGTAQQHRLAFEARGSLMANLADKEAARQVNKMAYVYTYVEISISIFIYLFIRLYKVYIHICFDVYIYLDLSIYLSICLYIYI